jgi:hypothetical protein
LCYFYILIARCLYFLPGLLFLVPAKPDNPMKTIRPNAKIFRHWRSFLGVLPLICLLYAQNVLHAQEFSYKHQFMIDDSLFRIEVQKQATGEMVCKIYSETSSTDSCKEFKLIDLSVDIFRQLFTRNLMSLAGWGDTDNTAMRARWIEAKANEIFLDLVKKLYLSNSVVPRAGSLVLQHQVKVEFISGLKMPCTYSVRRDTLASINAEILDLTKTLKANYRSLQENQVSFSLDNSSLKKDSTEAADYNSKEKIDSKKDFFPKKVLKQYISTARQRRMNLFYQVKKSNECVAESKIYRMLVDLRLQTTSSTRKILDSLVKSVIASVDKIDTTIISKNPFYKAVKLTKSSVGRIFSERDKLVLYSKPDSIIANFFPIQHSIKIISAYSVRVSAYTDISRQLIADSLESLAKCISGYNDSVSKLPNQDTGSYNVKKARFDLKIKALKDNSDKLTQYLKEFDPFRLFFSPGLTSVTKTAQDRLAILTPTTKETDAKIAALIYSMKKMLTPDQFYIDSVQMEFNLGVLRNLMVSGNYMDRKIDFTSSSPIQFTSISHYQKLKNITLVDMDDQSHWIRLADFLRYTPNLYVDVDNYCPSDSVYTYKVKADSSEVHYLMKEKQSQIVEGKIYTDLIGFEADKPNGLVQFELSKKIPVFTRRFSPSPKYRSYFSFGGFYEPIFTFSKLEQNNRYLYLQATDTTFVSSKDTAVKGPDTVIDKGIVSAIDLYRYSSMRFKFINFNIAALEIAESALAFEFNLGFSLIYTPMRDTITTKNETKQWGAISGIPSLEFKIRSRTDIQYGFALSADMGWLTLWDDKLRLKDPYNERILTTWKFDGFYRPFKRRQDAMFFRIANTHTLHNLNFNYLQVQLGYSFNLFK